MGEMVGLAEVVGKSVGEKVGMDVRGGFVGREVRGELVGTSLEGDVLG